MTQHIPFGWFYLANLGAGSIFLIVYGLRKRYPAATWLTIVAVLITLFVAGLKLMGLPPDQWWSAITAAGGEPAWSKFVPGGVLFFALGLIVIKWLMNFRTPLMDSMIMILPWMLIVQRTGCFINGCCYGKPADLPWSVSYPPGTSAFEHYLGTGHIHTGEMISPDLHPTQLYMIIGALLVWLILRQTRNQWKSSGSQAIFGMILLGLMRFVVEFFRETPVVKWYAHTILSVNILQWLILALLLIFTALLIRREKISRRVLSEIPLKESLKCTIILLAALIIMVWNLRRLFEFQELLLIQVLVTSAFLATLYRLYKAFEISRYSVGVTMILVIAFTTMSQDVIKTESDSLNSRMVKSWFNIDMAGSTGTYEYCTRDCSGNITSRETIKQASGGMDLSFHHNLDPANTLTYGVRGFIAELNGKRTYQNNGYLTYGINPYFNYTHKVIEIGFGLNAYKSLYYQDSMNFMPSAYLRLGNKDVFFVDAGLLDQMPLNGYLSDFHLGIGTGFKTGGKLVLRTGLAFSGFQNSRIEDQTNFYIMGDFKLSDHFTLRPGAWLGNQAFAALGLSFKFGYHMK